MCVDRREFMKLAGAAGIATGGFATTASAAEGDLPDSIANLEPLGNTPPSIEDSERKGRIQRAQRLMKENGIEALYLESGSSLFYFTGVRWGQSERMFGAVIPANGELAWVCPAFEEERARERIRFGEDIRTWHEDDSPYELVAGIFKDRGITAGKIGVEERVRFFLMDGIRRAAPNLEYVSGDSISVGCRIIKSPTELALMEHANLTTLGVYQAAVAGLRESVTHFEVSRWISEGHKRMGFSGGAGVQFGEYSAFPHGSRNPQKLESNSIVMMDGGCKVDGYGSDITRTVVFGKPTDKHRKIWDLEKKAQDAAHRAIRPGATCADVDAAARKVISDAGYGPDYEYFTHRVGHGIGLDGHEWSYLVRGNETVLRPGMCFSNEPGIYLYGEFGVRLEDCFYVTEDGAKMFTTPSPSLDRPFA